MALPVPTCAEAADAAALTLPAARAGAPPCPDRPLTRPPGAAAGRVPLRHFGSLHSDAARGGTPLVQSGSVQVDATAGGGPPLHAAEPVQALAAAAVRPSEPAATAAEITAPAATRQT